MEFNFIERTTDRLRIRRLCNSDVVDLCEIYSDPEVVKHWGMNPVSDEVGIRDIVSEANENMDSGKSISLAITEKNSGKLVGLVLAFNIVEASKRSEIGYAINREYWRRGYVQEALTSFIEFLFSDLSFRRLEADINPINRKSANTLLKLGFEKEGLLRSRWEFNGLINDSEIYGLLNPHINKPVLV